MLKRTSDIFLALLLIAVGWPFFILIVLAILFSSGRPVIFKQIRAGKDAKPFIFYKFRTMDVSTPAYVPKPPEDYAGIDRVGKFLRKCFLDELPQVLNVLKGEMSFVGPRPEMPFIVEQYTQEQRQRLKVKPGITGLWQLSGCTNEPIHKNLGYDLDYIRRQSFFLDQKILFLTLVSFFKSFWRWLKG